MITASFQRPHPTEGNGGGLLGNMSAPSKSVVEYRGLEMAVDPDRVSGRDIAMSRYDAPGVFGSAISFDLPIALIAKGARGLLEAVAGRSRGRDPEQKLMGLIEERAQTLPLPDGALVVPFDALTRSWFDLLTVLAVLTKCSDAVWLRGKTPRLGVLRQRPNVALLIPPDFVPRLDEDGL